MLYFTNLLREEINKIPVAEPDEPDKSLVVALQHVFRELQFSDSPVDTQQLTKECKTQLKCLRINFTADCLA